MTGPAHIGSEDIYIGSMSIYADVLSETLLAALRKTVATQAPLEVQSKASQQVDWTDSRSTCHP